ncbi:MAG: hypothetical protein D6812_01640, partial [Deltaproteobacteria bacterium]
MKRDAICGLGKTVAFMLWLLLVVGAQGCPPEAEERGIVILQPTDGAEIVGPRTDIHARFEAEVIDSSLQVILNGVVVNEYVHFEGNEIMAFDVPLEVGDNHLEIRILEEETRTLLSSSVDFTAGPPPLSIRQGYIFEVPLDIDPGRAEGPTVLTLYANF